MRSTAALHEETKPSSVNAAQNSQIARSNALAVSTMAARPRSFMIARVLPPLAAASRASRDMSSRPFGDREAVERRLRAGLGFDAADIVRELDEAAGLLDFHRLARRAHRQYRIEAAGAARRLDQRQSDPLRRARRRAWRRSPR